MPNPGRFDIIWAHSTYSDQVARLKDEFPDILFVVVGSGNEGLGGNQYWVYKARARGRLPAGALAGHMTESNVLGAVRHVPADDVNVRDQRLFRRCAVGGIPT